MANTIMLDHWETEQAILSPMHSIYMNPFEQIGDRAGTPSGYTYLYILVWNWLSKWECICPCIIRVWIRCCEVLGHQCLLRRQLLHTEVWIIPATRQRLGNCSYGLIPHCSYELLTGEKGWSCLYGVRWQELLIRLPFSSCTCLSPWLQTKVSASPL